MSVDEKAQALQKVESSPGSKRKALSELGVSKSDRYRWRARHGQGSLEDRKHPGPSWNRLSPQEESVALEVALEQTDLIQAVGHMDHRQQRLFNLRIHRLSAAQKSGTDQEP